MSSKSRSWQDIASEIYPVEYTNMAKDLNELCDDPEGHRLYLAIGVECPCVSDFFDWANSGEVL